MEVCLRPALREGGAAAQVAQVEKVEGLIWGPRAAGRDCQVAGRGEHPVGPRVRLWEAELLSQALSPRKAMEEEGVRNFKELRAKFQKFDGPPIPRPTQLPAAISQKGDRRYTQSAQILANGKPPPSNHSRPLSYCSSGQIQPPKTQRPMLAHGSDIKKSFSSSGPPSETSATCPPGNVLQASVPLDVSQPSPDIPCEEEGMVASSFRHKLWTWEKVSSQKSQTPPAPLLTNRGTKALHLKGQKSMGFVQEKPRKILERAEAQTLPPQRPLMAQINKFLAASEDAPCLHPQQGRRSPESPSPCQPVYECELASLAPEHLDSSRHLHVPKMKPLPSIKTLGPPPPKPAKPLSVNLQAFQKQVLNMAKIPKEVTVMEGHLLPDSAEIEEAHNYEATISYLRHSGSSINLCATAEIADATYEVGIEELQKPWKCRLHQELSRGREDEENYLKETEPYGEEPRKPQEKSCCNDPHVGVNKDTAGKIQMPRVHRERQSMTAGKQDTRMDISQVKVFPEDRKLARHSQDQGSYVEALEVTKETPNPGTLRSQPSSEETYDDVECSREDGPQWDVTCSLTSDSEENSEEMYEDIYKTKSSNQKIDLDGRAALKRLQKFFKREKGRFKIKTTKSKENVSNGFSTSLPDLGRGSRELTVYDDVGLSEKESKVEDKQKSWKATILIPKRKKEPKSSDGPESFSPRNFFKAKKQNLEKNKMEREEKRFRERFQISPSLITEYDKEIIVINRAVACSSNSRNGVFDLTITSGEELEVIDTTEQNQVICRNSKGKYGYVLIEHLHFKHQG